MIIIFIKDINLDKRSELIYVDMAKVRVLDLIIQVWGALLFIIVQVILLGTVGVSKMIKTWIHLVKH